ncbi:MAG: sensor histidine kinase [Nannocystaceae bacterium]|nr:sensor histidine kinase [Nannocystaceae bacterium]
MRDRLESRATLPWLVQLRWLAIAGQIAALVLYHRELALPMPWRTVAPLLAAAAASNLALMLWLRRHPTPAQPDRLMGAALTIDTLFLTALLAASGGTANPFTIFYLAHIVLAAVVLETRSTVWITLLSALCFGALFLLPDDEHHADHAHMHHGAAETDPMLGAHLRGMWIAFAITAAVIAFFVRKISLTIAAQREQIAALREREVSRARLASLAALSAGAAHELGTPLGTVAVAAREIELTLTRAGRCPEALADARLIAAEIERCRSILGGMAAQLHDQELEVRRVSGTALLAAVRDRFGPGHADRIVTRVSPPQLWLECPVDATARALASLVKNGFDASATAQPVALELIADADGPHVIVRDHGTGMPPEIAARAGEPFFTTKQPGEGMGLGLFIARSYFEAQGGELSLRAAQGGGTAAIVRLPARVVVPAPDAIGPAAPELSTATQEPA